MKGLPEAWQDAAAAMVAVGREMHDLGLVAGLAGNLSARVGPSAILVTPAGCHLGRLELGDMVEVRLAADAAPPAGATSELPLHRAVYLEAAHVGGVVHTHAPALVAAGLRGIRLEEALPEMTLSTGSLAALDPLPSGSSALGQAVGDAVAGGAGVILLRGHGAVAVGSRLRVAADRMALAELSAYAVLLGVDGGGAVSRDRLRRLMDRLAERL